MVELIIVEDTRTGARRFDGLVAGIQPPLTREAWLAQIRAHYAGTHERVHVVDIDTIPLEG